MLAQLRGFSGGSDSKESVCNAENLSSIPGLRRSPGGGRGNSLQYSCQENPHGQRSPVGVAEPLRKWRDTTRGSETLRRTRREVAWRQGKESEVAQLCPTLYDPMDCSPPGSSIHGIFQARVLEWVATAFSRGSSQPRDRTRASRVVDRRFTV